jgi:hypothetical protein
VQVNRDEVSLHGHTASNSRFNHGFKGPNLTFRPRDLPNQIGGCLLPAYKINSGLRTEGGKPAEDEDAFARLHAWQQGEDRIVTTEGMLRASVECWLARARVMIHNAG